ncbi:hypothetical protein ACHAW6_002833 [Cyclotella cf. meneghiniana]
MAIKIAQHVQTGWEERSIIRIGSHRVHAVTTLGCDNPENLNNTAIIDTGANISLLDVNAPAERCRHQTPPKSIIQPKGPMLTTTANLVLLLNKLPTEAQLAYRTPGIKNNLIATSELVDAGCGCEVALNG